jgi:hypothetical protein
VAVAKPRSFMDLRKQHAVTAVAAIQFICKREPDPGGTGCGCTVQTKQQRELCNDFNSAASCYAVCDVCANADRPAEQCS